MSKNGTERAVLYARVSGDDRKYATSGIESQLVDCRKYAREMGYQIAGEFFEEPDKMPSGADWLPELEKVLLLAHQDGFDVLVVREIDRLARNRFKQMSIENDLADLGKAVAYVIGQFEDTPEGRLLKGMMGEFAEFERGKTKQRTRRGQLRSVNAGNVTIGGSNSPYGYDLVKKDGKRQLVINETEAGIVRLIFDFYGIQGYSLHGIGRYLDENHVPKPAKGNNHRQRTSLQHWSTGTISGILNNETYIGHWYYRKTKRVKDKATGKYSNVPRPRDEWILIEVPSVTRPDLFERVRARRKANKRQKGKNHRHFYLLGAMLQCALCGNSASGVTKMHKGKPFGYYKCNAHHMPKRYGFKCENAQFKVEDVDSAVWAWVKAILLSPERLHQSFELHQEKEQERLRPWLSMLETNRAKHKRLHVKNERLLKAYTSGVLELDEFSNEKVQLEAEISDLGQAIQKLEHELEPNTLTETEVETIENYAEVIRDCADYTDSDPETQRNILQLLETSVTLGYTDGQRWSEIECILGTYRLPTSDTTTWFIARKNAR